MAKSRPSVQKRINEARKMEKAQEKAERKAARKAAREADVEVEDGVDPDLAGITPGPQRIEPDPLDKYEY